MMSTLSFTRAALVGACALALHIAPAAAQSAASTPLDALVRGAAQWAALADAAQSERMWDGSGPIMQQSMARPEWTRYVANLRDELGPIQGRDWTQVARVVNPNGLPPGEYLNVMFVSRFSKMPAVVEKVSLAQAGGRWIPVGYVVTKAEPPGVPPQAQAPTAPTR